MLERLHRETAVSTVGGGSRNISPFIHPCQKHAPGVGTSMHGSRSRPSWMQSLGERIDLAAIFDGYSRRGSGAATGALW